MPHFRQPTSTVEGKAFMGSPCPYCDGKMSLADSERIYKQPFGWLYMCSNHPVCDTYVGCHQGTQIAMGTPANWALRDTRMKAHRMFDPIWQGRGNKQRRRNNAYKRMQELLEIPEERAHIAMLTLDECTLLRWAIEDGDF